MALKRPPRKFQTSLNPEWVEYQKEQRLAAASQFGGVPAVMQLEPEEWGKKVGEEGAWVIVMMPPPTEYTVEPLSIWYAVEDEYSRDDGVRFYRVRILTPDGPLWLWPHEYTILQDLPGLIREEGMQVHYLSDQAAVQEDRLFYLRSRGIGKQDALLMLIGDVKEQTFCYFTSPRSTQWAMAGVGVPHLRAREHVLAIMDRLYGEGWLEALDAPL